MKRMITAFAAIAMLVYLLPASAQHGKGMGNAGGQSMSHQPITHGKSADTGSPRMGKSSPTEMLGKNTKLAGKLESLLPAGTKAQDACSGFKNLGQCVAAVHVSHNLGLTFDDLKTKMLGTPATDTTAAQPGMSLGKAIQTLDPKADATAEVKKANKQASSDLKG